MPVRPRRGIGRAPQNKAPLSQRAIEARRNNSTRARRSTPLNRLRDRRRYATQRGAKPRSNLAAQIAALGSTEPSGFALKLDFCLKTPGTCPLSGKKVANETPVRLPEVRDSFLL